MKTRRVNKRRAKTRRGGRYVYKGAYGCVFRPAIKCKGEADRAPGQVSKLMDIYAAKDEFALRKLVEPLDPTEQYFIYPSRICDPDITNNPENNYPSCTLIDIKNKHIVPKLLLSTDGGTDLNTLHVPTPDLYEFLKGLQNLFAGLRLLHENKVAHMDIKPSNIVGKKDGSTYKIRYIDFGLTSLYRDVTPPRESYPYYPFDARFVDPYYTQIGEPEFNKELVDYNKDFKYTGRRFPAWLWYTDDGRPLMTLDLAQTLSTMVKEKKTKSDYFIEGCDIFALGRSLSEIYSAATGHYYVAKDTIDTNVDNEYQRGLKAAVSVHFYKLVELMVSPNVFERPTAEIALTIYAGMLKKAATFFNP